MDLMSHRANLPCIISLKMSLLVIILSKKYLNVLKQKDSLLEHVMMEETCLNYYKVEKK